MTIQTFPTLSGLTFPAKRSPIWSTLKHRNVSGKVSALQQWTSPLYKYDLPFSVLRSDSINLEWQTLLGFYNSVGGGAQMFRFTDPDDGSVTAQSFGTGDAATTTFQLVRSLGGFVEPVFDPDTLAIYLNGVLTAAYTESNGLITFTPAPGVGVAITWTGTFNWFARFDDDSIDLEKFAYQFWELKRITFTTEKL